MGHTLYWVSSTLPADTHLRRERLDRLERALDVQRCLRWSRMTSSNATAIHTVTWFVLILACTPMTPSEDDFGIDEVTVVSILD